MERTGVGSTSNHYGGVVIAEKDGKYYWIVENYDSKMDNIDEYEEIPKYLYEALKRFSDEEGPE